MNLSPEQVNLFWRLWAAACRAQGWTLKADQERERRALLARCGFKSLTIVDRVDGFTRVKNEIKILVKPDLQAAQESEDSLINKARNFRWVIENEILPCLGVYEPEPVAYLRTVMEEKNRWWKIDRPVCEMTLDDLDAQPIFKRNKSGQVQEFASTLEQLLFTLTARLAAKRRAAGHSEHDMRMRAGLKCNCATICAKRQPIVPPLAVSEPATAGVSEDPDWRV